MQISSSRRCWCQGLQPFDVALELGSGEPAAAPDVDGAQVTALDQGVERGSADAEQLCGLFWRQKQRVAAQQVRQPLRVCHVSLLGACVLLHAPLFAAARLPEKAPFSPDL
jgi:hypothetical protein